MREPRHKRAGVGPGVVTNTDAARMIARLQEPAEVYTRDTVTKPPVPSRSQPHPGPACETTGAQTRSGKRVVVNPETNAGPEYGPTEDLKSRQEHGS